MFGDLHFKPSTDNTVTYWILLRSEIPSGMCTKLRTVATSNNRDNARNLSYYCLLAISLTVACSQSLLLLLARPTHMMVLFFTHIPFVVNHTFNAIPPERLQQHPLLFTTNYTDRTFFVWKLNSVRPSHPGHSTILLRSEIPSGMRAKLRTVAASNNRDNARNLSYYCLLALHIWWWYSSRTSRSWWIIQSTQHHWRSCSNTIKGMSCFFH